jgi:hypothetical protein
MSKRYGSVGDDRLPEPLHFELFTHLDDEVEVHAFRAVRRVDTRLATRFVKFGDDDVAQLIDMTVKLISKTLDDKDGTSATWSPVRLPLRDGEPARFRGPDGELYEMEHAEKFAAFEAGSSRRRFLALTGDQDRTIQIEALAELTKDLIAASAERPTDGSAPSSR